MKKTILTATLLCAAALAFAQNATQSEEYMRNMAIGNKALEMGRTQDAINSYKELIRISPSSPDPYLILGNIYARNEKDAESVELAIYYYKLYLEADPQAGNASQIKTRIYELEYVQKDAVKAQALQKSLAGKWASCLLTNGDGQDFVIFDFSEIQGKIRVAVDPSTIVGSKGLSSRVAYAERSGEEFTFSFTEDKTYVPSQANYDMMRSLLDGMPGMSYGSSLGKSIGQSAISAMQEGDVTRNTKRVYQFYLRESDGEITRGVCREMYVETTYAGQKVLRDTMFNCTLFAVDKSYASMPPFYARVNGKLKINPALERNYPDIYRKSKSGDALTWTGVGFVSAGAGVALAGVIVASIKTKPGNYASGAISQEQADKENEDSKKLGNTMALIGGGLAVVGVPMICIGIGGNSRARKLYDKTGARETQKKNEMGRALMLKAGPASASLTYKF